MGEQVHRLGARSRVLARRASPEICQRLLCAISEPAAEFFSKQTPSFKLAGAALPPIINHRNYRESSDLIILTLLNPPPTTQPITCVIAPRSSSIPADTTHRSRPALSRSHPRLPDARSWDRSLARAALRPRSCQTGGRRTKAFRQGIGSCGQDGPAKCGAHRGLRVRAVPSPPVPAAFVGPCEVRPRIRANSLTDGLSQL